jgi:predicted permease
VCGRALLGAPERRLRTGRVAVDVRQAWRALTVRPGSLLAIGLVLGLGVGLTSAMFAIADPYLLRPLPYANPDDLVVIDVGEEGLTRGAVPPTLDEWRSRTSLFAGLAAYRWGAEPDVRLRLPGGSAALVTLEVTPDFFAVLGVPGVSFGPDPMPASSVARPMVLLGPGARALASAPPGIGTVLRGQSGGGVLVSDVAPDTFVFPWQASRPIDGLCPFDAGPVIEVTSWDDEHGRELPDGVTSLTVIGRLQRGVTPGSVQAALAQQLPSGALLDVTVTPLRERMTSQVRPLALGTLAASLLIMLICAGNVANMLVARETYRQRETLTVTALGATRFDLVRQLLIETTFATAAAVLLGLGLAQGALEAIAVVIPAEYATLGAPSLTLRVAIAAFVTGGAVMVLALIPAALLRAGRWPLVGSERAPTGSRRMRAVRFTFAAGQSAFAMILVVGALLLVQSYANLVRQDVGFDEQALLASVSYPQSGDWRTRRGPDVRASLERLRRLPGVSAAGAAVGGLIDTARISVIATVDSQRRGRFAWFAVTPGFFEAAGMTVSAGRAFTAGDRPDAVVVVNQAGVRQAWPGQSPIGHTMGIPLPVRSVVTVVGVVQDTYSDALDGAVGPIVYAVMDEWPPPLGSFPIHYVMQVSGDPAVHRPAVQRALSEVNPDAILTDFTTVGDRLADTVRQRTFATLVLTLFGIAGAAVTIAGLVGIVAFVVARRTRELAVRIALGAHPGHVRRAVVGEAVAAAISGGVVGMAIGRWLSTWLGSFAYGVEAGNWTTAVVAGVMMTLVMIGASVVTAERAVRLSPVEALRAE